MLPIKDKHEQRRKEIKNRFHVALSTAKAKKGAGSYYILKIIDRVGRDLFFIIIFYSLTHTIPWSLTASIKALL